MRFIDSESARNKNGLPDFHVTPKSSSALRLVTSTPAIYPSGPLVAILLCIFQGKHFLSAQLESIAQQSHQNWRLYISDDGGCEESKKLIEKFKSRFDEGQCVLVSGPQKGFVANFLSLTCDRSIDADYFAFSDQDDIWHKNKLEKSIQFLSEAGEYFPGLYCSRTVIVDKDDKEIGLSPLFMKAPSFANALVQNLGGANSMIFNKKAREIVLQVGKNIPVVSHDWWMYLLVSGCNGFIKYDPNPSLRYRQHDANLVGSNIKWTARFNRIYMLLMGRFKDYNERNIRSLWFAYHLLSPESQKLLDQFSELRNSHLFNRIAIFSKTKIYRQSVLGNLGLWFAVFFNKL